VMWESPSMEGLALDFGPPLATGGVSFARQRLAGGAEVGMLSRGLEWEYAPGESSELVFSVADDLATENARLARLRSEVVLWFALLAALLLGTLAVLLRRVLRPIRAIEQQIHEIESGQRGTLDGAYPRELEGVARSLNVLLDSEQRRITRYRDTLGNLAHGLKTPLAVMRAALAAPSGASVDRAALDREIDRIAQIVDHQLKRAATSGGAAVGQQAVSVASVLADLRGALLRVHAAKDLSFEVDVAAGAGFVGDAGDFIELLGNLADNAAKWCRHRVRVSAGLEPAPLGSHRLWLKVEDDGPGIAPADRERVLARGVRGDEHIPGHGLGLAMVADTVNMYGGRLEIGSSRELGGASVEVRLPGRALDSAMIRSAG
jgi:two-component system sensor histidine kinase PhoQ